MKKSIAVIFGGEGAERQISERSAATVIERLEASSSVMPIGISDEGDWFLFEGDSSEISSGRWRKSPKLTPVYPSRLSGNSGFVTANGVILNADLAFPVLHGDFGEDGVIQGALSAAHIPYIGSDVTSSALTADKAYTKIIAEYLGIPTVPWFIPQSLDMKLARREAERRLGYPLFIKPRRLGSSIGAAPVYLRADFKPAWEAAMEASDGLLMIEALADVKLELELALFDGKTRFISHPGIVHSSGRFYDFHSKYDSESSTKTEADGKLERKTVRKARSYARQISDFLGLGNISRIDFFLSSSGEIYFNEINSIPGMTDTSLYPPLAELYGGFPSFAEELAGFAKPQ